MKEIHFDKMPEYWSEKGDEFMRLLILEADQAIKLNTPVDTGRMRASWQIAQGEAVGGEAPAGKHGGNVTKPNKKNYQKEKFGETYSIHNNLPYAEANAGRGPYPPSWGGSFKSKNNQVEVGWFDLIAKNLEDRAEELWEQMAD
jgi:hypothetical protein